MTRRWNANTWVLVVLGSILALIAIDVGRSLLVKAADNPEQAQKPASYDPGFKVGDPAPDFTLPDRDGKPRTLSQLVKRDTMLMFTCGCAQCMEMQVYVGELSRKLGDKAPDIINATTMPPVREESWLRDTKLKQTILYMDRNIPEHKKVDETYKGHPCPRTYKLTPDRTVAFIAASPAVQTNLIQLGFSVAEAMGFGGENDTDKKLLKAHYPKNLEKVMLPPAQDPAEEPNPRGTGAAEVHSPGDGHNH